MANTGSVGGASGLPAVPTYLAIAKNEAALAQKYANSTATVKADVAYFQKKAPTLTTADSLMKDYRALSVVLSAFNMSKEIAYPALVRKLLTEDPSSSGSAARKIGNASYYRFATAMGQYTTNPFSDASGLKAVTDAYVTNAYEAAQGKQVPGLADALAFKRQASQITSVANLMSNKSLTKVAVAQTALDWSTFGVMSYERQVAVLTKGFNAADYQDSAKVDRMAEQYLVMAGQNPTAWDASTATAKTLASLLDSVGTTDPILSALLPATGNFSTAGNPVLSLFA